MTALPSELSRGSGEGRARAWLRLSAARQRRRAQILSDAGLGALALARWRLSGHKWPPDPKASRCWVPVHALLGRRGLLGATSPEERAFCQWYGRIGYRGLGAIVDLGSWLGSTTVPLARGMASRPPGAPTARIHAYDRFLWDEWMSEFAAAAGASLNYRPGDDFRSTLEDVLGSHRGSVDIHTADLRVEPWTREPIELVVVDAMKSWDLARNILQEFLTSVVSNGVVFHQDFAHYYTPWIHLIGYRLREHFVLYYDVPHSDGVAFRLRGGLRGIDATQLASPDAYQPDEVTAAFRYSRGLVGPDKHASITAAEAMFYVHTDDLERAAEVLRRARQLSSQGDLITVERLVEDVKPSEVRRTDTE